MATCEPTRDFAYFAHLTNQENKRQGCRHQAPTKAMIRATAMPSAHPVAFWRQAESRLATCLGQLVGVSGQTAPGTWACIPAVWWRTRHCTLCLFADQLTQRRAIGSDQFLNPCLVHLGDDDLANLVVDFGKDPVRLHLGRLV